MSGKSNIEWTQHTWNPFVGCKIHSPGCINCYAMKDALRIQRAFEETGKPAHYDGVVRLEKGRPIWTGAVGIAADSTWLAPLRRKKPTVYFVNSMSDLFYEGVSDEVRDRAFAVMALCPQHIFQVLTKRSDIMRKYLAPFDGRRADSLGKKVLELGYRGPLECLSWPLPNVWLGVSTERQQEADERIPDLLQTPAALRWISAEPLIGPLNIENYLVETAHTNWDSYLDWVVVGGESKAGARPMHPEWVRSILGVCHEARVPAFFKQWGEWAPIDAYGLEPDVEFETKLVARDGRIVVSAEQAAHAKPPFDDGARWLYRVGKKKAGAILDGREYRAMPNGVRLAKTEEVA